MKRYLVVIGLMLMMLAVAAAQCSTARSNQTQVLAPVESLAATSINNNEEALENGDEERAGVASNTDSSATENEPEPVTGGSESPAADDALAHGADAACEDPFVGVGSANLRFYTGVWTAEQLARMGGEDIVKPDSGLATNFCLHNVDYREILSGGPPPDGIPPIDNPNFDTMAEGNTWLSDNHPVIALVVGGEARAYPLGILTRHEIVNDEIAGVPVAVTFCPLCNAGIVFNREANGEVLRFGVSGNLRNSDLVMWDNQTLSWWQQFTGEAIVGQMTGTQLDIIPAQMVAWRDFKVAYPDGVVLSNNGRNYDVNPYAGYDSSSQPFLFRDRSGQPAAPDPRLPALERVLGYAAGDTAVAYPLSTIAAAGVIANTIDGQDVVIFYEPGAASALDDTSISASREVGAAAMFSPQVKGRSLTFDYNDGIITDHETGSEWNIFGRAISGALAGAQLEPMVSHTHFWFAWAAFRPDTLVYKEPGH
ncbi:MAG: DUF3179 domain-containing protein [Anaerolineae bacterium]|nr:DUF3179 domain-containing protein [Anaerolineae bacterium]